MCGGCRTIAEVEDEFSQFLDDASEDIMASAATLDSVARLGPNRANPKWCAKARTQGKGKVKQLVLGISVKCKQVSWAASLEPIQATTLASAMCSKTSHCFLGGS